MYEPQTIITRSPATARALIRECPLHTRVRVEVDSVDDLWIEGTAKSLNGPAAKLAETAARRGLSVSLSYDARNRTLSVWHGDEQETGEQDWI